MAVTGRRKIRFVYELVATKAIAQAKKLRTALSQINNTMARTRRRSRAVGASFKRQKRVMTALARTTMRLGRAMLFYVTLPIVGAIFAATKAMIDFDAAMQDVNTIAKVNDKELNKMGEQVLALSVKTGEAAAEIGSALKEINQATIKGADAMFVLEKATIAAVAGNVKTKDAAKALASVLKAYSIDASEAGRVSDLLFKTVERGMIEFRELASHMGTANSTAATIGLKFEEVAAAAATMTKRGVKSAEAFTALNRLMLRIAQSEPKMQKVFATTAEGSGEAFIQARGLGEAIDMIFKAAGGSVRGLKELGIQVRGLKAAATLGRDFAGGFAVELEQMTDASGATDKAFQRQMRSFRRQLLRTRRMLEKFAIQVSSAFGPTLTKVNDALQRFLEWLDGTTVSTKKLIAVLAVLVAAGGPILLITAHVAKLVMALKAWNAINKLLAIRSIPGVGRALTTLFATPWGLAILGIVTAMGLLIASFGKGDTITAQFNDGLKKTAKQLDENKTLWAVIKRLTQVVQVILRTLLILVDEFLQGWADIFRKVGDFVKDPSLANAWLALERALPTHGFERLANAGGRINRMMHQLVNNSKDAAKEIDKALNPRLLPDLKDVTFAKFGGAAAGDADTGTKFAKSIMAGSAEAFRTVIKAQTQGKSPIDKVANNTAKTNKILEKMSAEIQKQLDVGPAIARALAGGIAARELKLPMADLGGGLGSVPTAKAPTLESVSTMLGELREPLKSLESAVKEDTAVTKEKLVRPQKFSFTEYAQGFASGLVDF